MVNLPSLPNLQNLEQPTDLPSSFTITNNPQLHHSSTSVSEGETQQQTCYYKWWMMKLNQIMVLQWRTKELKHWELLRLIPSQINKPLCLISSNSIDKIVNFILQIHKQGCLCIGIRTLMDGSAHHGFYTMPTI